MPRKAICGCLNYIRLYLPEPQPRHFKFPARHRSLYSPLLIWACIPDVSKVLLTCINTPPKSWLFFLKNENLKAGDIFRTSKNLSTAPAQFQATSQSLLPPPWSSPSLCLHSLPWFSLACLSFDLSKQNKSKKPVAQWKDLGGSRSGRGFGVSSSSATHLQPGSRWISLYDSSVNLEEFFFP